MRGANGPVSILAVVAMLAASASRGDEPRRVAVPSFVDSQAPGAPDSAAPKVRADESMDLVGPTERQAARAKAAAEAKAKADAEARAKAEAEAKARIEAEA